MTTTEKSNVNFINLKSIFYIILIFQYLLLKMVVFIVLRHVNNETTNDYWQESCEKINQYYPDKHIFVIDDHSKTEYLNQTRSLKNITVIQSEFSPGKGEILPYYYFHKYKWDTHAIVFHDSVYIKDAFFDESHLPSRVKFLWHTDNHTWDSRYREALMIKGLKDSKPLLDYYLTQRHSWALCFGVMSIVSHEFLETINTKYDFFNVLVPQINTRDDRMRLERIYGVICCFECKDELLNDKSYIGDINIINKWDYTWEKYKNAIENQRLKQEYPYALVRVFTGR
jgi:hypothetical protein